MPALLRFGVGAVAAAALAAGAAAVQPRAPVTFGPSRHRGLNAVRLMRVQKAADFSYVQVTPYQVFKPLL
jgi:hypothetical protein